MLLALSNATCGWKCLYTPSWVLSGLKLLQEYSSGFSAKIYLALECECRRCGGISSLSYLALSRIPLLNTFYSVKPSMLLILIEGKTGGSALSNALGVPSLSPASMRSSPCSSLAPGPSTPFSHGRCPAALFHLHQLWPFAQHTQCNDMDTSCWMHLPWGSRPPQVLLCPSAMPTQHKNRRAVLGDLKSFSQTVPKRRGCQEERKL